MSISKCGLKQIGFCNVGSLGTTPVDPLVVGFRKGATLDITPHNDIKDYRNRSFRNMINFKTEAESLQPSMRLISKMHSWLNQQADVQIVTNAQGGADSEDVFKFMGNYLAGIDFELVISHEMRSLKITTEASFEYDLAKSFIDAADSDPAWISMGVTGEGGDLTLYRSPYYLAFQYPSGTSLFSSKGDIVDRKLTIKTKGKKTIYNQSIVDYLSCTLEITARDAGIIKIKEELEKSMSGTILWKEHNNETFYDAFAFAVNALTVRNEVKISDDDRTLKVILEGDVPVTDVSFQFGAGYGGDAEDTTGLKGGTMTLG